MNLISHILTKTKYYYHSWENWSLIKHTYTYNYIHSSTNIRVHDISTNLDPPKLDKTSKNIYKANKKMLIATIWIIYDYILENLKSLFVKVLAVKLRLWLNVEANIKLVYFNLEWLTHLVTFRTSSSVITIRTPSLSAALIYFPLQNLPNQAWNSVVGY